MAVEELRGCGTRRVGGTYIVSDPGGSDCERMPLPLVACSHCGEGIKQNRGFRWVPYERIFDGDPSKAKPCGMGIKGHCRTCPVCTPSKLAKGSPLGLVGILWIGARYYPTPEDFLEEASRLGVSRRVAAWPKGLTPGTSWVAMAHPAAQRGPEGEPLPGIVHVFRPARMELIVTPSIRSEDWVQRAVKQGATLIEVPDNDPDHAPTGKRVSPRRKTIQRLERRAPPPPKFGLLRTPIEEGNTP